MKQEQLNKQIQDELAKKEEQRRWVEINFSFFFYFKEN